LKNKELKKDILITAKTNRKKLTDTERFLWKYLRSKQLEGFKFKRQQPIKRFIVDFICFEKKVIIELDGGQHALQKDKDLQRDKWFEEQGFTVLRFWDNDVLTNIEGVLEVIRKSLLSPSPISAETITDYPLPSREGNRQRRILVSK
jgi:very-short-patch-repair endonuclease